MALKVPTYTFSDSTDKQMIISLDGYSHEQCVAVTEIEYWRRVCFY